MWSFFTNNDFRIFANKRYNKPMFSSLFFLLILTCYNYPLKFYTLLLIKNPFQQYGQAKEYHSRWCKYGSHFRILIVDKAHFLSWTIRKRKLQPMPLPLKKLSLLRSLLLNRKKVMIRLLLTRRGNLPKLQEKHQMLQTMNRVLFLSRLTLEKGQLTRSPQRKIPKLKIPNQMSKVKSQKKFKINPKKESRLLRMNLLKKAVLKSQLLKRELK